MIKIKNIPVDQIIDIDVKNSDHNMQLWVIYQIALVVHDSFVDLVRILIFGRF